MITEQDFETNVFYLHLPTQILQLLMLWTNRFLSTQRLDSCKINAMPDYKIPAKITRFEQEIKKSRFIAYTTCAATPEAAHDFINKIKIKYPDARHVCWAFVAGKPSNTTQISFSDDGEPNGTAGMPMLNVLQHGEIGDIVVAVVRYFGGIKLGTGGLARAYSSSVSEILKTLPVKLKVAMTPVSFFAPFSLEDPIRRTLIAAGIENLNVEYNDQLSIQCDVPENNFIELKETLNDMSRGQINITLHNQVSLH